MGQRRNQAKYKGVQVMGAGGKYLGLEDMINGGGAGAAGSEFKGAPISELLNSIGATPYGSQVNPNVRPQMRPQMPQQAPQGMPSPSPVQMGQLPPQMPQGPQMPQMGGPQGMPGQPVGAPQPQQSGISQYYQMLEQMSRGLL